MLRLIFGRNTGLEPALRSLLIADVFSLTAQMLGYLTVPWWIAKQGGAHDLARYGVVMAVALILCLPLLSPLGERYAKRTQMVRGLFVLAGAALLFALLASFGGYDLRPIIGVGLLGVLASAFVDPASASVAPELVSADRLPEAMRLRKTAQSAGRLLGPLLGGAVLAGAGVAATLWLGSAMLLVASLAASRLPQTPMLTPAGRGMRRWYADLRAGLRAKWSVPLERGWTLVNFLVWIFVGPAFSLFAPLKVQSLGLSGAWLGACEAGLSIGMLLGGLLGTDLLVQWLGRYRLRIIAAVTEGLCLALIGYTQNPMLLVAAFVIVGYANTNAVLVGATHRALAVPQEFRVRMAAVNVMSTQVANALGPTLAGLALLHWSFTTVATGFGLIAAVLACGFMLIPRSREFFGLNHDEVKDWYRLQYPQGFRSGGT